MGVRNRFPGEEDKHTDEPKISTRAGIPLGAWKAGKSFSVLVLKEMSRVRNPLKCHCISFLSEHEWAQRVHQWHLKGGRETLSSPMVPRENSQDGKGVTRQG